jgi:hypothetical protein
MITRLIERMARENQPVLPRRRELLAERSIVVGHVTIYRSVQRPELIGAARPSRHVAGDCWFVDETYLKVAGQWVYRYRAIDQHGQVIDVRPRRSGIWRRPAGSLPGHLTWRDGRPR